MQVGSYDRGFHVFLNTLIKLKKYLKICYLFYFVSFPNALCADKDTTIKNTQILRAGDQVLISVYGEPLISGKYKISSDMMISHSLLGDINVGQMNCNSLSDHFKALLKDGYIHDPQVSITRSLKNPFSIAVVGEVENPGQIQYDPDKSIDLASAIGLVGGLVIDGDLNSIEVKRADQVISAPMPKSRNMLLKDGDVVMVPKLKALGTFTISGEVVQPGLVEIPRGKKLTLFSAINLAGGPTQSARLSRVEITRIKEGKPNTMRVNASDLEKIFYVLPGDEIVLKAKIF